MDTSTTVDHEVMQTILSEKTSICILSLVLFSFLWCITRSIQMLSHNRQLIYWLCLFANLLGPVRELAFLLPLMHVPANCQVVAYVTNYAHELSLDCIMIILLVKATVSNEHNKLIYTIGGICLAASIGLHTWHAVTAVYTRSMFGACGNTPDPLIAILWFCCLWTLNTFLSGCFLIVIYKHHRRKQSPIYKSFLKDGMYFFLLITLSNIITPSLVIRGVLGENSSIIFDIDWAIQCVLITLQLCHSSKIRQGPSSFEHSISIPHDIEQFRTGYNPKPTTTSTGGKANAWEGYLSEIPLDEIAQHKPIVLKEDLPPNKTRPNSVVPLTKVPSY